MLVLHRKCKEQLFIDDAITVTVLAVEGGRVKLGIEAPRDVVILRQEVREREAARREERPLKIGQAAD